MHSIRTLQTALAGIISLAFALPAFADNEMLAKGYADYNAGHYNDARDNLQGALATEFNNAKLHYFLANTYIHLNQKEAAIKEFRIAYALDPDKEVGKLSKQALSYLTEEEKPKDKKATPAAPPTDPILDKITATLQKQADQAKEANRTSGDIMLKDLARLTSGSYDRAKQDMQKDNSYYRRGRLIQLPLPDDALRQLDLLKHHYDGMKNALNSGNSRRSDELQRTADNLNELLNDKSKSAAPHLTPTGTNLYIRNYESKPGKPAGASSPSSSAPSSAAPASAAPTSAAPTSAAPASATSASPAAPAAAPSSAPTSTPPAVPGPPNKPGSTK